MADSLRGADAGHDVLTLRVHQVFAEQALLAGGGVARERHAGARVGGHVAEDHALHGHGGAPGVGNRVHAAEVDGAWVVPGAEHSLHGLHKLLDRVGGERASHLTAVFVEEETHEAFEILGGQIGVLLDAAFPLELVEGSLEAGLVETHDHVGVHLDESTVGVPCPAGVAGLLDERADHVLVESEVEDRVHHAGHRDAGAGAHGDQERILRVTKPLPQRFLHFRQRIKNLGLNFVIYLAAVSKVTHARFGADGKAFRHRHAQLGHFGHAGTLAAQKVAHRRVAFRELVYILFAAETHVQPLLLSVWCFCARVG